MIKAKVSTDYKDIERIFAGGAIQKEIIKVWSTEANDYVFEAWRVLEMESPLPLTFNANGEPLIDYRIYGNTEQTGTPTPENPIMPIGCGERTENLFDYVSYLASVAAYNQYFNYANIQLSPNTTYTLSTNFHSGTAGQYTQNRETPFIVCNTVDRPSTLTGGFGDDGSVSVTTADDGIIELYIRISRGYAPTELCDLPTLSDFENGKWVMIVEGSTLPDTYIPYGYKLPILSNSTVTNIYLGASQTTRRIKKLVLTGKETWGYNDTNHTAALAAPNSLLGGDVSVVSTHYTAVSNKAAYWMLSDKQCCLRENDNYLWIRDEYYSTMGDFKSYLAAQYAAGTPVTVWYVLAEPETGIVNEPLMKIGDYADTVSMEQAGVSIPTNNGSTVIDYDGGEKHFITSDGYKLVDKNQNGFLLSGSTLRPEKMYIKYKGR